VDLVEEVEIGAAEEDLEEEVEIEAAAVVVLVAEVAVEEVAEVAVVLVDAVVQKSQSIKLNPTVTKESLLLEEPKRTCWSL